MALEFSGPAVRMGDSDLEGAAKKIGCTVAAVRAVIDVESRGGFLPDTRPRILFERHYFCRLTGGRYNSVDSNISAPHRGGYLGGPREYDRLEKAIDLDRPAALRSASWGAFQVMGDNCASCGFAEVEAFVAAMVAGEPEQLDAFVKFVKKANLDDELIRLDWAGFARGYNGAAYKDNRYDEKLAASYAYHSTGGARVQNPLPVLKIGDSGDEVRKVQGALKIEVDGDFGPATKNAVVAFQKKKGLYADGIVGAQTWCALGLA